MAVGNMIRVLKGNREKLIPPTEKTEYLSNGYSVIDEDGTVLEQGVKSNHTLKSELEAANRRIAELEAANRRIAELEAELRQYQEAASPSGIEEPGEEQDSGEEQEAFQEEKKRGRKSGQA